MIGASFCDLEMVGKLSFVYCFLKYIKIKKETIATIKLPWLFFSFLKYWSHGLSMTLPVLYQITRVSLCRKFNFNFKILPILETFFLLRQMYLCAFRTASTKGFFRDVRHVTAFWDTRIPKSLLCFKHI